MVDLESLAVGAGIGILTLAFAAGTGYVGHEAYEAIKSGVELSKYPMIGIGIGLGTVCTIGCGAKAIEYIRDAFL